MINYIIKKKQINLIYKSYYENKSHQLSYLKSNFCAQEYFLFVSFIIYLII